VSPTTNDPKDRAAEQLGPEREHARLPFDLWHLAFANLMQDRAPPNFEIQSEVRLTIEPQRADLLLLRRIGVERQDEKARILLELWPWLGLVTVLEYKSPVDSAFRRGDLLRLVGYGVLYDTAHLAELPRRADLTLVLVVASVTPTLLAEIERMGWTLAPLGGGYGRIDGAMYTTYVVVTDDVSEAERDDYLRLFSHHAVEQSETRGWLRQWMKETKMKQPDSESMPEWDDMMRRFLDRLPVEERLAGLAPEERLAGLAPEERLAGLAPEERLAGLAPEERLAGLAPEERLAGLATEQVVIALPLEVLRVLPEEYVRALSVRAQEQIRQRLQGATH
jgi:hypothetical protein